MRFPDWLTVYGDQTWRGDCPPESAEQITFFIELRRTWPNTFGKLALHPRNEGRRTHAQTQREKLEGMTPGAADIIIPGAPTFVCELKRQDHTRCKWEPEQIAYLKAAHDAGAFVCVALGWAAGIYGVGAYTQTILDQARRVR